MVIFVVLFSGISALLNLISAVSMFKHNQSFEGFIAIMSMLHIVFTTFMLVIAYQTSNKNEDEINKLKRKIEILKNRCNIEDSEFDEIDTIKTPIEMKNNDETSLTKQNVTPSENPEIEKSPKTAPCPLCATEIDVTEEICPACGYDLLEWKYYNKK